MASGYIAGGAIAGIMVALFSLDYGFLNKLKGIKDSFAGWASGDTLEKATKWVELGRPAQIESSGKLVDTNYDWLLNLPDWLQKNGWFAGNHADWLGMIPFWILAILLYYVGRELILKGKKN
jgi:hypothetical protein